MSFETIAHTPLKNITVKTWEKIYKKEALRGHHIDRLARAFSTQDIDKLFHDTTTDQISFLKSNGKLKHTVNLMEVTQMTGDWSLARLCYWIKKNIFCCCSDQTQYKSDIHHLAQATHQLLNKAEDDVPVPSNELSQEDFVVIKNILQTKTESELVILDNDNQLEASFRDGAIFIQSVQRRNEKISIQINPKGRLMQLQVDGADAPDLLIPEDRANWLPACFKMIVEITSSYSFIGKFVNVKTLKKGVERNSSAHLQRLSLSIKDAVAVKEYPRLNVALLKNDLSEAPGSDNGGISRDYLNSMMTSVLQSGMTFQTQKLSQLKLPFASVAGYASDNPDTLIPHLNDEERSLCIDLGRIMMFCYRSKPNTEHYKNNAYVMGQHFDDLLIEAALSLKAQVINKTFNELTFDEKSGLIKLMLKQLFRRENKFTPAMAQLFKIFDYKPGDSLSAYNCKEVTEFAGDFIDEDTFEGLDMDKVNADPVGFVQTLQAGLLNHKFGETSVAGLIAPVHAVAQGLKSICHPQHAPIEVDQHWNQAFVGMNARAFSEKVQGVLDRNKIVAAFEVITTNAAGEECLTQAEINEITKKKTWLENWIKNPRTNNQALRKFLVYMTGSNSLPDAQKLFIHAGSNPHTAAQATGMPPVFNPVPAATTCKFLLLLSPVPCYPEGDGGEHDSTEVAFHQILNKHIAQADFFEFTQD